ncbi:cysteine desulfurase family protein [Lichenicoccus sp.]|uniref:cysteine desulfurase family protein n=1 Tax=Lichenicoccus sp. TaxID=2781899 RepID=UPI003D14554A
MFTCFDANATEPLRPEALAAMVAAAGLCGNPASPHRAGRQARQCLEASRAQIAGLFGAAPDDLVFTSGGTEANALALHNPGRPVLAGATEHDCVRAALPADATLIGVAADGTIRLDELETRLREAGGPALVCLMLANNETGVVHPLAEAAALCAHHGAWLHVDAVQAAGRIAVDLAALGAQSLALSAHKLGGPKGAGALLLAGARRGALAPVLAGGGQERGRRGGTPALPAIAGFAAAAVAACGDRVARAGVQRALIITIEQAAVACGARIGGEGAARLPNTVCLVLPGRRAEGQLIALDLAGYGVSAGSACSSGKVARSHVLAAMGYGDAAGEAIRVSLPWNVEPQAVAGFIEAYAAMVLMGRAAA